MAKSGQPVSEKRVLTYVDTTIDGSIHFLAFLSDNRVKPTAELATQADQFITNQRRGGRKAS
jgi:hypothetical protein